MRLTVGDCWEGPVGLRGADADAVAVTVEGDAVRAVVCSVKVPVLSYLLSCLLGSTSPGSG